MATETDARIDATIVVGLRAAVSRPPRSGVSLDAMLDAYAAIVVAGDARQDAVTGWHVLEATAFWDEPDLPLLRALVQIGWNARLDADAKSSLPLAPAIVATWRALSRFCGLNIAGIDLVLPTAANLASLREPAYIGSGWFAASEQACDPISIRVLLGAGAGTSQLTAEHLADSLNVQLDKLLPGLHVAASEPSASDGVGEPYRVTNATAATRWAAVTIDGQYADPEFLGWIATQCLTTYRELSGSQPHEVHLDLLPRLGQ